MVQLLWKKHFIPAYELWINFPAVELCILFCLWIFQAGKYFAFHLQSFSFTSNTEKTEKMGKQGKRLNMQELPPNFKKFAGFESSYVPSDSHGKHE